MLSRLRGIPSPWIDWMGSLIWGFSTPHAQLPSAPEARSWPSYPATAIVDTVHECVRSASTSATPRSPTSMGMRLARAPTGVDSYNCAGVVEALLVRSLGEGVRGTPGARSGSSCHGLAAAQGCRPSVAALLRRAHVRPLRDRRGAVHQGARACWQAAGVYDVSQLSMGPARITMRCALACHGWEGRTGFVRRRMPAVVLNSLVQRKDSATGPSSNAV